MAANWDLAKFVAAAVGLFIVFRYFCQRIFQRKCSLANKVVIITGATSGLGKALAHQLYKHGCKLILTGQNENSLNEIKQELLSIQDVTNTWPVHTFILELTNSESIASQALLMLDVWSHVDVLINNAGVSYRGDAASTSVLVDRKLMEVNYFGPMQLTKALLPSMRKVGFGHIVVISSVQGRIAIPFRSAYSASKHATTAFYDTLRAELADENIFVTVAIPSYIKTNLSMNALTSDGHMYGRMDETTSSGMSAEFVAEKVIKGINSKTSELNISIVSGTIAMYLRSLLPDVFFWLMRRRAVTARREKNQTRK